MGIDGWRPLLEGAELQKDSEDRRSLARGNLKLCRALAQAAFDDRGHLDLCAIDQMVEMLQRHLYCLPAGAQLDTLRRKHILKILRRLKEPHVAKRIHALGFGLYNRAAEQLVEQTLLQTDGAGGRPGDRLARVAVVCAWLTYLRQNVGSCFATAPAIAIQSHHPERFLDDMHQLLQRGMLTRAVGGKEISVPLTYWGSSDLWRPLQLTFDLIRRPEFIQALAAADLFDRPKSGDRPSAGMALDLIARWYEAQAALALADRAVLRSSAGQILRNLLLFHFELSNAQYEQWELSSRSLENYALETSGILVQPGRKGGVASRCLQLRDAEERARTAFKATADNALLRAWEYCLASFSESRADFQQWNLSISIGMQGEPEGLTKKLNDLIGEEIKACNEQIDEARMRADQIRPQLIYVQGKLQNAHDEHDLQWGRAECHQVKGELDRWEETARNSFRKGEKLAILAEWFIEKCVEGFRDQFQEVYDPDLRSPKAHTGEEEVTEDTPAGFRLVAKQGRSLATSWVRIEDEDHFIEVLCRFFTDIETQFRTWPEVAEIEREFGQIITRIIHFVRDEHFLKGGLARLQNRAHLPKESLPPTPWAYISGGNLEDLLHQYCSLKAAPSARPKWFDDVRDFWVYLIDEVQGTSVEVQELFLGDPEYPLLMASPDHAFNLKPGSTPFCRGWQHRGYPYTWIRDAFELPTRKFYSDMWLSADQQKFLEISWRADLERTASIKYRAELASDQPRKIAQVYQRLADSLEDCSVGKALMGHFESKLFSSLPLMDGGAVGDSLRAVFERASQLAPEKEKIAQLSIGNTFKSVPRLSEGIPVEQRADAPFITASDFWELLLNCWQSGPTSASDDLALLQRAAQELGYLAPSPVEFADSNWVRDSFAFAIHPATLALEIWCVERWGQRGRPMASWRPWFDKSKSDRKWAVYPQTAERNFFQL